jgi:hypothetical protein
VAGGEGGRGEVLDLEGLVGGVEDGGSHGTSLFAITGWGFWSCFAERI